MKKMSEYKETLKDDKNIEISESGFCNYCYGVYMNKRIIKCSKCDTNICKSCITYINNKPFCPNCIVDFVRNETWIIFKK